MKVVGSFHNGLVNVISEQFCLSVSCAVTIHFDGITILALETFFNVWICSIECMWR